LEAENAALKDKLGLCECDNEVLRLKESERNATLKRRLAPIEAAYERLLHSDFPIRNDVQEMWQAIKESMKEANA
jgi:hypothetical protein